MTLRNLLFGIWLYVCLFMACTQLDEYSVCVTQIGETQVAAFEQGASFCTDIECVKNEARQRILITAEYVSVCEKSDATEMP